MGLRFSCCFSLELGFGSFSPKPPLQEFILLKEPALLLLRIRLFNSKSAGFPIRK